MPLALVFRNAKCTKKYIIILSFVSRMIIYVYIQHMTLLPLRALGLFWSYHSNNKTEHYHVFLYFLRKGNTSASTFVRFAYFLPKPQRNSYILCCVPLFPSLIIIFSLLPPLLLPALLHWSNARDYSSPLFGDHCLMVSELAVGNLL